MSSSSSPGEERARFFDSKAKSTFWSKAETVPGRHPDRWRKDAAGNIVCNCQGCLCFNHDHIVRFSKEKELDILACYLKFPWAVDSLD